MDGVDPKTMYVIYSVVSICSGVLERSRGVTACVSQALPRVSRTLRRVESEK
jgi:hypothetical protein